MITPLRIIFYGTPDFAVPSLNVLLKNNHTIVAVVTAPDKPSGRGQKILYSAIKEYAIANNIPVLQPTRLKDENFLAELKVLDPDLQVVVAFRMMPEQVWKLPKRGTINLHASLLPQYRGAAPINWAIINGETVTGVTTFFLRQEIDTGDILFQEKTKVDPDETAGQLHDRLMVLGADLVLKTVNAIRDGSYKLHTQTENLSEPLKSAPKLNKENTRLNIGKKFNEAYNFIRGLAPYPAAYAELFNSETGVRLSLKIFRTSQHEFVHDKIPGTVETDNKTFLRVYFPNGYLDLLEIQLAGRSRIMVRDFLNGFKMEGNWALHG